MLTLLENLAGIQVNSAAMVVPCKVLGNVDIQPKAPKMSDGMWNMINRQYESSGGCSKVFYIHCNAQISITEFHEDFLPTLNAYLKVKITPSHDQSLLRTNFTMNDLDGALTRASKWGAALVIFLVPKQNNTTAYTWLKQLCDQKHGLKTVCMDAEKALRTQRQGGSSWGSYVANVGMKINMKLGGTNHMVKNLTASGCGTSGLQNTMILGADVTHPSPGSIEGTPSVAAVVGSVDKDFTKLLGSMRWQAPRGAKQSEEVCVADILVQ